MHLLLIVTERFDPHVDFVEPALDAQGTRWRRLHIGDFPAFVSIACEITNGLVKGTVRLKDDVISLADVHAVWYRRTEPARLPPDLGEGDRLICERESSAFIQALWRVLRPATWVSHPDAIRRASSKAEQLLTAHAVGFRVPHTCFTNDPASVRAFMRQVGRACDVIYKPHTPIFVDEPGGKKGVVYTTRLDTEVLKRLDEIQLSPGIFQAHIPKREEVRVTVVNETVFACRIDSQAVPETRTDWRAHRWDGSSNCPRHEICELPVDVADKCRRMVASYGLMYGAIDLIVDPTGEYWFLEINPNGQWAWIQQATGQPIREALCRLLHAPTRRF